MNFFIQSNENLEFSFSPHYSSYRLRRNDNDPDEKWCFGGEIGVANIIPNIGLKLRATRLNYEIHQCGFGVNLLEYTPITLCTSFNLLPFLELGWLKLTAETGIGLYLWRGLRDGEVVILPDDGKFDEKDIGFIGGITLQLRPIRFIGLEFASRYNYVASADIYKYGFTDKDEKIWENGFGLKIILPLVRR
jgi:hypothetical protein